MAEIKIDDETTKAILRSALEAHLTPEAKDKLIADAVHNLLKSNGVWGNPSDLQRAMGYAASEVAREICKEEFDRPETREKVRELWAQAWEKFMNDDVRDKLVEKMAEAIGSAMFGKDRY
jgi:hypothetical protein